MHSLYNNATVSRPISIQPLLPHPCEGMKLLSEMPQHPTAMPSQAYLYGKQRLRLDPTLYQSKLSQCSSICLLARSSIAPLSCLLWMRGPMQTAESPATPPPPNRWLTSPSSNDEQKIHFLSLFNAVTLYASLCDTSAAQISTASSVTPHRDLHSPQTPIWGITANKTLYLQQSGVGGIKDIIVEKKAE